MSNSQRGFPEELLQASNDEKIAYFKHKIIAHPQIASIRAALLDSIYGGYSIVYLIGPPGVGKSTLISRVDPDCTNTFLIEAVAEGTKRFDWKDFHIRFLYKLHKQLPELRVLSNEEGIRYDSRGQLVIQRGASEHALRRFLEDCLKEVKLDACLIDEAPHFATRLNPSEQLDLMNVVKSLASLTETVIVLTGTYELVELIDPSPQLCRRSNVIHFKRYCADN